VAIYAARHPERVARLILEDPARFGPAQPPPSGGRPGGMFPQLPLEFGSWDEAVEAAERAMASPRHTEDSRQRYLDSNLVRHPNGRVTWRLDRAGLMAWLAKGDPLDHEALMPFIAQLRCPTLVVRGGNSRTLRDEVAAEMTASNSLLQVVDIEGAGHGVHFDKAAEFLSLISNFAKE
jgi:pimeloyl-ACP methyl ester carboxylesterase